MVEKPYLIIVDKLSHTTVPSVTLTAGVRGVP